jgi:type II secretory pathway predicted ATPase ExeA
MTYEQYWKLAERPFENNYDLRFLYLPRQHEEAITRMVFSVYNKRPGVLLCGEYGSGKSIILHYLMKQIREMEKNFQVIHISNPMMAMGDFYREFLHQLGSPEVSVRFRPLDLSAALRERNHAANAAVDRPLPSSNEPFAPDLGSQRTLRRWRRFR